ncbi:LacI family transcriptional regulator [Actinoplanes lutulentus]|uniref:LacI family transcriptional regulator n=1 Tax=Actinoplanes lutulentus TaxID=1287878 RepID=A0A327ZAP7_9ACTN|nr:LacI family DNA-binding transcriptional regulator [Actinoplanes lutulentus]MBB2947294.1 LacI family transcriptional regulator [Actinoplanes lutulentus]RAK36569.1 LacI family transcriptional regulator [Actinoplanes lutulentus]
MPQASGPESAPRRVTIRDVAARAGVSIATVSRVLGGTYPPAPVTRSKVLRAVRDLDYVANPHARALSGASSKTIAIVLNSVISPYYAHVAQGVQAEAARHDRLCLIGTTAGDAARELATVRLMREEGADAVILVGNVVDDAEYKARMTEYAHALAAAGSQLVLCGRPPLGTDAPSIGVEFDNTGGARAAASHLLSAGHERILYVGHRAGYTTSEGRIAGYREALAAFGVAHDPALEIEAASLERSEGYRLMKRRLQDGPPDFTAVFAANDLVAAGALRALRENGLRVPQDISLIGYDDLPPAEDIGLTTVHVPHEELGRTAARLVLERGSGTAEARHVMLGTHIVVRDTVRPAVRRR